MNCILQPQVRSWTRAEYHRMAEFGFFDNCHVELVEGQVINMAAMNSAHAVAVDLACAALALAFGSAYYIRQQKPLVLSDVSEPEPDIAAIKGSIRNFAAAHPTQAELVVEVADSSLKYDRGVKQALYAKAGICEYWILNLGDRQLETYRSPIADPEVEGGFRYAVSSFYSSGRQVAPLVLQNRFVVVDDLLP